VPTRETTNIYFHEVTQGRNQFKKISSRFSFQLDRTNFMTSFITRRSARVYQQISGIFREIGKEKRLKNAQESKTRFLSMLFIYLFFFS